MRSIQFPGRRTAAAASTVVVATALWGGASAPVFAHGQVTTPVSSHAHDQAPEDMLGPDPTSPTAYEFGETLAGLEGEQLEVTFLAEIIGHHQAAIEMAQLELERGTSLDIRTHAENIIASQQHQIDQFTTWLEEWYGLTPEEAKAQAPEEAQEEMKILEEETRMMVEELAAVEAGEDFDVAFVQKMIPHHNSGIIEFLELQSRADHAQLRVASSAGITAQQAQIADFRTWLAGQN